MHVRDLNIDEPNKGEKVSVPYNIKQQPQLIRTPPLLLSTILPPRPCP